jgi:hypothetical protein
MRTSSAVMPEPITAVAPTSTWSRRVADVIWIETAAEPAAPGPTGDGEGATPPAAAGDDDLDQFQGWLKGLKPQ